MTDSLTSSIATPGGRATIVAAGMGYPNRSGVVPRLRLFDPGGRLTAPAGTSTKKASWS